MYNTLTSLCVFGVLQMSASSAPVNLHRKAPTDVDVHKQQIAVDKLPKLAVELCKHSYIICHQANRQHNQIVDLQQVCLYLVIYLLQ